MLAFRTRVRSLRSELPDSFWLLWLGTIINRLGGFVIPFLSLYLTSQRGVSVAEAGLIVALFGAGSFVSQIVGGELADRLGRRPVLVVSLLVTPFLTIGLGLGHGLPVIAALTFTLGLFTDLYRPAVSAAVSDLVPAAGRTRAFGYMYWAINLGAALAPIVAGLLAHINYLLLFIGDALTTLIYGLIILWRFRESRPAEAVRAAGSSALARFRQLRREPILLFFCALSFLAAMIYIQSIVTLPIAMSLHGLGPADYGLAIASNAIVIVIIQIPASRLIGKWPRFGAMSLAVLLLGAGFGLNGLAAGLPLYMLGVMIWTLGEIINAAVAPTIIADLSPLDLRGLYQGIYGAAWGLSFFVGPLLGSWVFERFSPSGLWFGCAALACLVAASLLALARPAHKRLAAA